MNDVTLSDERETFRRTSLFLAAVALLVPMLGFMGWLTGHSKFSSYGGQFIPMAPSSTIGLILLSGALLTASLPASGPAVQRVCGLVGGLVAAYGGLVLFEWLTGWQTNPDNVLFPEMGTLGTHRIGRMSHVTGGLLLLAGISLASLVRGRLRREGSTIFLSAACVLGAAVGLAGLAFVLSYMIGEPLLYHGTDIPVALPTAISLLFLGFGLAASLLRSRTVEGGFFSGLNDVPIGTQLRFGLGVILMLVLLLGALDWVQTDKVWLQTKTLYEHPFQVRIASKKIESDVEMISHHFLDQLQGRPDQDLIEMMQTIEVKKADVARQIAVLERCYLGPREDVRALQESFAKWNAFRDDALLQLRTGKLADANGHPWKTMGDHADEVRASLKKINDFAISKSEELYQDALKQKDGLAHQLAAIVAIILLLSLAIVWILLNGIRSPLAELTATTEQFRKGNLDARCRHAGANEFGALSASFNAMAETLQLKMHITETAANISRAMLREDEPHAFCRGLLKELLLHTGSQVGAVYFLNKSKTAFDHFESIGMSGGGRDSFSAAELEGELGAALATRKIQHITDIPEDSRFTFAAVSGKFSPRAILTIPIASDHTVTAVVSLASIHAYSPFALRLVNEIWSVLTARMNGILAFRKIKGLAERLESQNHELDAQNRELDLQKRELDGANRLKSTFLANMSHELRTPLNSVIALSGVLSRRLSKSIPAEEFGYLEIIERNGKNLLLLINDILDLSRIESGYEEISITRFSLRDLVAEVVSMVESQTIGRKIVLLNQVPADLPPLSSDSEKLRHILQNIVGNAVKFTEQGQVTVTADLVAGTLRNPQPAIRISVADTGIGIAASKLPHIFDEFRQADESTSRKYGGTGLGLAIAKKYAALLAGDISVESTEGKGSTFVILLPLVASSELPAPQTSPAAEPSADPSRPTAAPAGQGQRILLVEDNESAIIQLLDILQAQGYLVQVAHDGKEALAQIAQALPDAMILDLMMPEVDGFEVLKSIRSESRTQSVPVLILTAKHITKEELSFLKSNHVYQLIQKGDINKEGLLAAVARMVEPAPPLRPARADKPVVLVVEDHPDNRFTACALLSDLYQVIEAADGKEGLDQARAHHPDIILMDIGMPVMDGVQALQEIRKDESLRHLPVIAVTASAMKGDQEAILAYGFDAYLSKPIDAALLKKTILEALD